MLKFEGSFSLGMKIPLNLIIEISYLNHFLCIVYIRFFFFFFFLGGGLWRLELLVYLCIWGEMSINLYSFCTVLYYDCVMSILFCFFAVLILLWYLKFCFISWRLIPDLYVFITIELNLKTTKSFWKAKYNFSYCPLQARNQPREMPKMQRRTQEAREGNAPSQGSPSRGEDEEEKPPPPPPAHRHRAAGAGAVEGQPRSQYPSSALPPQRHRGRGGQGGKPIIGQWME